MSQEELIHLENDRLALSPHGELRARQIIRRHRLAERLFHDTFGLGLDLLDSNACKIEHTLAIKAGHCTGLDNFQLIACQRPRLVGT